MNKIVYLTILLYSFSFSQEIWEKEIPPSKYLEKLVTERETLHENSLKYISYASIGLGLIGITNKDYNVQVEALGYLGLSFGLIGLTIDKIQKTISPNKPRTLPGKEFEKIKNKTGKEKEMLSYEILVKLAEKSRKPVERDKKNKNKENLEKYGPVSTGIQQLLSNFMTNRFKEQDIQYGMTLYEKVLDNYLNQKPIN
tara:strand:- start:67 stop:660 length:594 start_codon:yes stop_codon:yes gene_type:complete